MLKKLSVLMAAFFAAALSCAALFTASAENAYISGISLAKGGDAEEKLENSGFGTVMTWNLNPGSEADGRVLLGYNTGGTPITGIIVTPNSGNTIKDKNNVSYSLASTVGVSGGACFYVTTDKKAGDPIVSLDIARCDNQSDDAIDAIAGNGSETVRDINGKSADLGSGSDRYTIYMRVVRSSVVKPFIGELSAVTGSDREDAVYQAASKGFDYFAEGDLLADDNQYTVFAYNRTRDAEKAIRCVAALRTSDANSKSVKINGVTYKKASGTVKDKKTPYVLYTTTDGKAGNPIIDGRVGEDAALSDCPMSVWLRGYYGSQMDLTSIYAKSEELYTALEKDNTIYTMLPVVLTDPNAKAQQGTTATAEGVSPFVIKGNGPTTINVIGSGTSEFEANGTGVFYAANNIKVTLNIIKTDAKAEVFMKNSATRLQAVSCGPYSGKVSSTTKTESGEFYTYSSGSITKKEEGTFNLTGGSVFMNPEGVTQTQRKLYWYYGGVAARGNFDTAYLSKTTPAIKYSSLLTLKGSLTKDSMLLIDTDVRKTHESEFSILLSAASFTSTTDSSPIIVTGKNDAVINLFYSGKNTLSFSKEVPLVDVRTGNRNKVRVNLIKTDNKAQIKNNGQAFAGLNSLLPLELNSGAVLDIIDTCPDRSSYVGFRGGGRSNNGGGNNHIGGGTLNMTGGHIYDGQCNEDGGGIYLDNGSATLKNVTISNCQAKKSTWVDNEGGAVYVKNEGSHLTLDNCRIDSCRAYDYGGAIMVDEGKIRITDSVITNCRAEDNDGGAINAENDTELYVRGCEITNCSADERGGAVFVDSEDGTWLIDTRIRSCSSGDHGGGIYINDDKRRSFCLSSASRQNTTFSRRLPSVS